MQTSTRGDVPSSQLTNPLPLTSSHDSSQGEEVDMVVMLEEKLEMERRLQAKTDKIRELQYMLDVMGASVQKHKREAEEELRIRQLLAEENESLKKVVSERNGTTRLSSSGGSGIGAALASGGSSASAARLNRQLEEAERAKAIAEEEAEGLKQKVALQDQELRETKERLAKSVEERVQMSLQLDGQKDMQSELAEKRREVDMLYQKLHDLQRSLLDVKHERDSMENAVQDKVHQQRAEARKHQAALLEKNNELGALRRQLAERSGTGGKMLKMTIDMMRLQHAKEKLEAEMKTKDEELEGLKAGMRPGTSTPSEDSRSDFGGRTDSLDSLSMSRQSHSPSMDELHNMYGEQVTSLEEDLRKLRDELEKKQAELTEKGKECEETEQQKVALREELEALKREQQETQQHLRSLEALRATSSTERRHETTNAAELANNMEEHIRDLETEVERKDLQVQNLQYEIFELKKKLKMSTDQAGAANSAQRQQQVEVLQRSLADAEADREQLQLENGQMQQALLLAQSQREEIEQILQQTEDGLDQYYEEAKRKVEQYYREAQQCREDLRKSTEQSESLRRQLLETQKASQLQVSKMHKAKKQALQESTERIAQLEAQLEEKRKLENELKVRLQRQGPDTPAGRGHAAVLEGLRNELNKVRGELQRAQEALEKENESRVQAENLAERRQAQIENLQERVNSSFREERENLVREMEAHQQTRRELEQEREETLRSRRMVRELEEYRESINNIAVPDSRRPGHRLQLRQRRGFNCRSCQSVRHGFMWRCQDRNCQDIYCTDCLSNGTVG